MRKRYIAQGNSWVEVPKDYIPEPIAPMVWGDLPEYESPIDGRPINGRVQRREDLKRSGSRPWEGLTQEQKEAARQREYHEQRLDRHAEESAFRAWYQLSPEKRKLLER